MPNDDLLALVGSPASVLVRHPRWYAARSLEGCSAVLLPANVIASGRNSLGTETLPTRPPDVIGPADLLEGPDETGAGVDLAPVDPVTGAGRVGVVQVVPGLAHRQDRQPPDIGRPVAADERALADGVTDRVDRPRDVVEQADADQRPPEEGRSCS